MPKAVRKSVSRCSSRSSCRRRRSPRDNLLSSIREALRSSPSCNKRTTILKRESPKLQRPVALVPKINEKPPPEVKIIESKPGEKPIRGLIEHGIRYIMLPLHLLNFCVWGSPNASTTETETSSHQPEDKKNTKKRNTSPTSSTSGFSSCSSNFSKNSRSAPIPSESSPEVSDKTPIPSASLQEKSSSGTRAVAEKQERRNHPVESDDSDEMVTADEYFDDSSNERWSSAESSTSMNMSIDIEAYTNASERISSQVPHDESSMEEPMEVSMEESCFNAKHNRSPIVNRFRSNNLKRMEKKSSDPPSSSSCSEERDSSYRQDFSSSSADREIGRIFERASISLSSDDDDFPPNGRRNNPFANVETIGKRIRSFTDHSPRNLRSKRSIDREAPRSPKRSPNSARNNRYAKRIDRDFAKISYQTDSAYSDEDVEMNSINESYNQHLHQSIAEPSLRVIEWMEQDLDYVADAEDSNDASPISVKSTISSMKNDANYASPISIKSKISSMRNDANYVSSVPEKLAIPPVRNDANFASSQNEKNTEKSKKPRGVSRRNSAPEEATEERSSIAPKGPPGFPDAPQHPACVNCHCGNPKCFFLPVTAALPTNGSSTNNYPRAPSPLRHLYYEYPEFMSPPRTTIGDKTSPYVLVPANLVLP